MFGLSVSPGEKYTTLPPRQRVPVSTAIPNLVDFAERHGVTYQQLKEANLWLRSDKLTNKAGRTYVITIPGPGS